MNYSLPAFRHARLYALGTAVLALLAYYVMLLTAAVERGENLRAHQRATGEYVQPEALSSPWQLAGRQPASRPAPDAAGHEADARPRLDQARPAGV